MSKIIAPILYVLAAIGLYFTYISPAVETVQALQEQNDKLTKAIADFDELIERRDTLIAEYRSISDDDEARLLQIVPDSIDAARLVVDLDRLAGVHNLYVQAFKLPQETTVRGAGTLKEPGDLGVATMGMTLEGQYLDFVSFLERLERSRTLFDVVELKIGAQGSSVAAQSILQFNVSFQVYRMH